MPECAFSGTAMSPVNILLTDDTGRRTGFDAAVRSVIGEIPGGSYTGPGSEPQTVRVPYVPGVYLLDAFGLDSLTSSEPYTLIFAATDASGEVFDRADLSGMASRGADYRFAFTIGNGPITPTPIQLTDTAPPAIQCSAPDGQWHASDVLLACTASDLQSGLANPVDASFSLSSHTAAGAETSNALTDSRQVCDKAGNCAVAGPIAGSKVDRKPPSIASRRRLERISPVKSLLPAMPARTVGRGSRRAPALFQTVRTSTRQLSALPRLPSNQWIRLGTTTRPLQAIRSSITSVRCTTGISPRRAAAPIPSSCNSVIRAEPTSRPPQLLSTSPA